MCVKKQELIYKTMLGNSIPLKRNVIFAYVQKYRIFLTHIYSWGNALVNITQNSLQQAFH